MASCFPQKKSCPPAICIIIALVNLSIFCSLLLYLKAIKILELNEDKTALRIKFPTSDRMHLLSTSHRFKATPLPDVTCLIWPRIPKTGGENLMETLRYLIPDYKLIISDGGSAYEQDMKNFSISPHERFDLDFVEYYELIQYYYYVINHKWSKRHLPDAPKPHASIFILQYHAPFISVDLSSPLRLKPKQWRYMSMVRNPINRIVSSFYYLRGESGGWRALNFSKYKLFYVPRIMDMQKHYNIDECVTDYDEGDNVCEFSTNYYVKWFCGGNEVLCDPLNLNETSY
eukprot:1164087_1